MDQNLLCFCYRFPDVLNHVLFVLPLCYPKYLCDSFDTVIYLTSRSMHHLLTTQDFVRFLDYVTRNTAVSSFSITKSNLVISWPARKSVPSLGFLRYVSLGWVAPGSLLKLNKSSYKSMMTFIRSRDKWTLYYFGIKMYFYLGIFYFNIWSLSYLANWLMLKTSEISPYL